jgi:hypothetical protein
MRLKKGFPQKLSDNHLSLQAMEGIFHQSDGYFAVG